jgi:hypothetical protein
MYAIASACMRTGCEISDAAGEPNTLSENGYREANMSDENTLDSLSPEHQALLEDLNAYDNPEAFDDLNLPQQYKFRIFSKLLQGRPDVLRIEVNGDILANLLLESFLELSRRFNPDFEKEIREFYGDTDLTETRSVLLTSEEYLKVELEMVRFFLRYLPKLMLHLYGIIIEMSVLSSVKQSADEPTEKNAIEQNLKLVLASSLRRMKNDIQRMVNTRTRGRPKKFTPNELPEIVNKVIDIAQAMMGDKRGKDAVPGLKGIADKLNLTENALGKQLGRAGYSWTVIRDYLASQP